MRALGWIFVGVLIALIGLFALRWFGHGPGWMMGGGMHHGGMMHHRGNTPRDEPAASGVTVPELSQTAKVGEGIFNTNCAACHGQNASGVEGNGPPLVHKIYEPSHHADAAFYLAVQNGVRAHHWPYGNMPSIEGVTQDDVTSIIAYVRELQRANGIN